MKTKCQVPLFQSINPFSSSATNISIYHILMIIPQVLYIFALQSPWHNYSSSIQQKIDSSYFLIQLMCKFLLHCLPRTSGKSQVENVDGRRSGLSVGKLSLQQAKYSTVMFIIWALIITVFIILYLQQTLQTIHTMCV